MIPFTVFEVSYSFHKHHEPVFTFFFAIFGVAFLGLYLFSAYNGIMRINMILKKVEIDGSRVVFETFGTSMLFNLTKKEPQVMTAQTDQVKCVLSTIKYGFDRKYTGDIYLLVYAGDEYLIPAKFFEGFSELKAVFEQKY